MCVGFDCCTASLEIGAEVEILRDELEGDTIRERREAVVQEGRGAEGKEEAVVIVWIMNDVIKVLLVSARDVVMEDSGDGTIHHQHREGEARVSEATDLILSNGSTLQSVCSFSRHFVCHGVL